MPQPSAPGNLEYPSTLWTAILGARDRNAPEFRKNLDILVRTYWRPVYWSLRTRWNRSREDAQDITQAFFASFLEKDRLAGVGPEKGRFRTFLRVVLDNFMRNELEAARALKRGGGETIVSLATFDEEPPVPAGTLPPEQAFDRTWAVAVFGEAVERLKAEYEASGRAEFFKAFQRHELDRDPPTYAALAAELGVAEHDVEYWLKHARATFARILRAKVKETCADESEVEAELKALMEALG